MNRISSQSFEAPSFSAFLKFKINKLKPELLFIYYILNSLLISFPARFEPYISQRCNGIGSGSEPPLTLPKMVTSHKPRKICACMKLAKKYLMEKLKAKYFLYILLWDLSFFLPHKRCIIRNMKLCASIEHIVPIQPVGWM